MARVLVVDDEEDVRHLVRLSLELDGHQVAEAADGLEALRALGPEGPEVMVLDVTMPRLDGWEVLVRMKAGAAAGAGNLPVILLTARDAEVDRIRGGIEGAVGFLTKPFDPDDLRLEVRRALEEPEVVQRRRAALEALGRLAALERPDTVAEDHRPPAAHPHVTRLGGPVEVAPLRPRQRRLATEQVQRLSTRQGELLRAVGATPTVLSAAESLGVSRSNVYASLRRIARRLEVASVTELVALARSGVGDARVD